MKNSRSSKSDAIQLTHSGLKCDNSSCDWRDDNISPEVWHKYINAPCPKCGQNILTLEDFDKAMLFFKVVSKVKQFHEKTWVGRFLSWIGPKNKERATITYETHNNKVTIKKDNDENGIQTPNQS